MSYLVLARKWRPQTFVDVVGQETIVQTLSKALESGRIAHAFLFTGSRGVGKTTVARLLAKALVCEKGISPAPCGECAPCIEVAQGTSMDVVEIDGASNTSVDDVRALRENARYQPGTCRFKIFIIDEVHMLSTSAFNALLKTLEEPPPHVKFIFATTESHKIPITILSRCQRYDFKRLNTQTIVERLQDVLSREKISIDPAGLLLIAQAADGGMRDALSLTDQVCSFSSGHATLSDVTEILGLMDRRSVLRLVDALINGDSKAALQTVDQATASGYDLKQLMDAVAMEFRHLTIASSTGTIVGLADLTPEDMASIDQKAKTIDGQDLQRLFAMALESIDSVGRSEQPKLMMELAVLSMADRPLMAEAMTISHAISRLEALSKGTVMLQAEASPALPSVAIPAPSPKPVPKKAPAVPSAPLEGIDQKWQRFVETVIANMPLIGHHLENARLREATQNKQGAHVVRVEFTQKLHHQHVEQALKDAQFQSLLQGHYGQGSTLELIDMPQVAPVIEEVVPTINEARDVATKKAQEELEQQARNHPVVQKALSLFGGEIRSVKRE